MTDTELDYDTPDDLDELEPTAQGKPLEADDEFDELTADLEASQGQAPATADFDDLEADLAQALSNKREADAVKQARERAKSRYGNTPDDLERIRRWELAREWQAVANVALFRRYTCSCAAHFTVFEGLMLEQSHRTQRTSNRWTRADAAQGDLPNKTALRHSEVAACQACASPKGWDLSSTDLIWGM